MKKLLKQKAAGILDQAEITLNGTADHDITIHNDDTYQRVLTQGSLGFGESYVEGWWDTPRLDKVIDRLYRSAATQAHTNIPQFISSVFAKFLNLQTKQRAKTVAELHYDLGNDFYSKMLDSRMVYTCAYWKNADNLEQAQFNKLDLVCQKLKLQPGMRVLDLGCGFGGLAKFMAEQYGVEVVGYTLSREQADYGQASCEGLPVDIRCDDFRHATGKFDRVSSIGLLEHVGPKNYQVFFHIIHKALPPDGLAVIHSITRTGNSKAVDPWFTQYIFPNGYLPTLEQMAAAYRGKLLLEDVHNIGAHYDPTLMAWYDNFVKNWDQFKNQYPDHFFRMWEYYLLSSAGSFRSRHHQVYQWVLSPQGVVGGYESVR